MLLILQSLEYQGVVLITILSIYFIVTKNNVSLRIIAFVSDIYSTFRIFIKKLGMLESEGKTISVSIIGDSQLARVLNNT